MLSPGRAQTVACSATASGSRSESCRYPSASSTRPASCSFGTGISKSMSP
jgi:hypothetical protein